MEYEWEEQPIVTQSYAQVGTEIEVVYQTDLYL